MIDNNKLQEITRRITENTEELNILKHQRTSATTAADMVSLDKRIEDLERGLDALERTKRAVTYLPPKPTDKQILLSGINKHIQDKADRINGITKTIERTEAELMQTDVNLHTATDDGDADAVISYSDHSEELHKRLKYLRKMKADTESRPAFSLDDIMQTWLDICEQKRPDFQSLLSRIEVLANEYRAACDDLLKLEDVLLSTRGELEHIAEKEGMHAYFRPVLTVGVNPEPLKISKIDGIKPGFIIHDLTGTSL